MWVEEDGWLGKYGQRKMVVWAEEGENKGVRYLITPQPYAILGDCGGHCPVRMGKVRTKSMFRWRGLGERLQYQACSEVYETMSDDVARFFTLSQYAWRAGVTHVLLGLVTFGEYYQVYAYSLKTPIHQILPDLRHISTVHSQTFSTLHPLPNKILSVIAVATATCNGSIT